MKKYYLIGVKPTITLLFFLLGSLSLFAQTDKPHFNINNLSKKQLKQFAKFRSLDGKDRFDLFLKICPVIPCAKSKIDSTDSSKLIVDEESVPSIMAKQDLFTLLGKPWREREVRTCDYFLDKESTNCMVSFFFNDKDELIDYGFDNCLEHWSKMEKKMKK